MSDAKATPPFPFPNRKYVFCIEDDNCVAMISSDDYYRANGRCFDDQGTESDEAYTAGFYAYIEALGFPVFEGCESAWSYSGGGLGDSSDPAHLAGFIAFLRGHPNFIEV